MWLPLLLLLALGSVLPAPAAPADSPDVKITSRFTDSRGQASVTTTYIKGSRSRVERDVGGHRRVTINQCDAHQVLQIDRDARQYTSYALNPQGFPANARPIPEEMRPVPSGGTLAIAIETTDTGERKAFFGFTARHVITRDTRVPGPGAITPRQESVRDGWYVDVNPGCVRRPNGIFGLLGGGVAGQPMQADKIEVHRKGAPVAGYAVRLTTTTTSHGASGRVFANENITEVLDLSTAPLDPKLFDIPEG